MKKFYMYTAYALALLGMGVNGFLFLLAASNPMVWGGIFWTAFAAMCTSWITWKGLEAAREIGVDGE